MKFIFIFLFGYIAITTFAQTSPVQNLFPANTVFYQNIPYANDTLQKHLLDIYLPPNAKNNCH